MSRRPFALAALLVLPAALSAGDPAPVLDSPTAPDRVGRILIEGNTVTQDRVILQQLGLTPGELLRYPQIEAARRNLERLQLFAADDPPTVEVLPGGKGEFKDIRVRVKETRTGMAALAAGPGGVVIPAPVPVAQIVRGADGRYRFEVRDAGGAVVGTSAPEGFATPADAARGLEQLCRAVGSAR